MANENKEEKVYSFEELLDLRGSFVWRTSGGSMRPLIKQGRDVVVISKPEGRLKKYDVALYKVRDKYLLHRILEVHDGYYTAAGDNNTFLEKVPDQSVIGVMTELQRKNKPYDLSGKKYRFYEKAWCGRFRFKCAVLKPYRAVLRGLHACKSKIKKK